MQEQQSALGRCPKCGAAIRDRDVLITYERNGRTQSYAECPSCETVVHPE
ncbi:MAG: hypothetical protein ACOCP3_01125 [Halodesulfurarchaeum sp.]